MKKKWPHWDRIPGFVLLAGLGIAALVITATNSAIPLPESGTEDAVQFSSSEQQAQEEEALRPPERIEPELAPAVEQADDAPAGFRTILVDGSPQDSGREPPPEGAAPKGCVQVNLRHRALAGHPDRERCSNHRNLISMGTPKEVAQVNWNSVCLRVDGVVTAFERVPDGIVFGPFAGPDSRVTLRYCHGKATCAGSCDPPRDLFLEAIGATLKLNKRAPVAVAKWDPSDSEEDSNPTAAVEAELRGVAITEQQHLKLFKDWSTTSKSAGCGSAANPVAAHTAHSKQ